MVGGVELGSRRGMNVKGIGSKGYGGRLEQAGISWDGGRVDVVRSDGVDGGDGKAVGAGLFYAAGDGR